MFPILILPNGLFAFFQPRCVGCARAMSGEFDFNQVPAGGEVSIASQ